MAMSETAAAAVTGGAESSSSSSSSTSASHATAPANENKVTTVNVYIVYFNSKPRVDYYCIISLHAHACLSQCNMLFMSFAM